MLARADVQQKPFRSEATIFTSGNKQHMIMNRNQALYFARLNGVPVFLWAKQLQLRPLNALEPDNAPGRRRRQDTSHRDITQGEFNGLSDMDKMKSSRRAGRISRETRRFPATDGQWTTPAKTCVSLRYQLVLLGLGPVSYISRRPSHF